MIVQNQSIVAKNKGRFYGWPANCGMWLWPGKDGDHDEILVGLVEGWHLQDHGNNHAIDTTKERTVIFSRSYDGGRTWTLERPELKQPDLEVLNTTEPDDEKDAAVIPDCPGGIDFTAPGFAMMFQNMTTHYPSRSWFYVTQDKGHTWEGPYRVPMFCKAMSMRTDYMVLDKDTMLLGMTGSRDDGFEGITFYGKLSDGGKTWTRLGTMGEIHCDGFRIMPSTVRLPDGALLCATRYCEKGGPRYIEMFRSDDEGQSWNAISRVGWTDDTHAGNPPAMQMLPDGRILLVYGQRQEPRGMVALTSTDGVNWSEPFFIRRNAGSPDMGYPRMVIRSDGSAVAAYYYMMTTHYYDHDEEEERFIGATIFRP